MKLAENTSGTVIQGGILESSEFTIEISGKMFTLLSDTLYQNKIGSMVREVSCNAVDSHIQAGKPDEPFVIHAPNRLEPYFSVKDNGVGLTHQEVKKVFTCFGKSTKTNTNDLTGAFGFGSKTPFCYTDSFTVVAIKDGTKNTYGAIKGEKGTPEMNLMDSAPTDEPNGVEITVGVEAYDYREFYNEIASQLRHFKVKPTILGTDYVTFTDPMADVIETVGDVHFRKSGGVEVVQGGVGYPVDLAQLKKGLDSRPELRHFIDNAVQSFSPLMFFDIGQIAVTPSRESISYDYTTIKNILDRLEVVQKELVKRVTEKMDSLSNVWERTLALRDMRVLYSKVITFDTNPWGVASYGNDPYIAMPKNFSKEIDNGKGKVKHALTHYYGDETNSGRFRMKSKDIGDKLIPNSGDVIVVDDGATQNMGRLRRFIEETDKNVYFLHAYFFKLERTWTVTDLNGKETVRHSYGHPLVGSVDSTVFQSLMEAVDGAEVIFLDDLPKPERVTIIKNTDGTETVRPKYIPPKAYVFKGFVRDSSIAFRNFEKVYIAPKKMTEPAAYVLVDARKVKHDVHGDAWAFFRSCVISNIFDLPIYAIREKDIAKLKDNPLWVPLEKAIENKKVELLAKYKKLHVRAALMHSGSVLQNIFNRNFQDYMSEHCNEIADPMLRGLIRRARRYGLRTSTRLTSGDSSDVGMQLYAGNVRSIRERTDAKDKNRLAAIKNNYALLFGIGLDYYNNRLEDKMYAQFIEFANFLYNKTLAKVN